MSDAQNPEQGGRDDASVSDGSRGSVDPYEELTIAPGAVVEPGTSLVNKTGSWREERPVIRHEPCVGCGICVTFCPDNAVKRVDNLEMPFGITPDRAPVPRSAKHIGKQRVAIDYDYCKGCGICATECPIGVIDMVEEVR